MDAQSPPPCETFNTNPLIRASTAIEFVLSFILSSLHSLGLLILNFRFGLLADIQYTLNHLRWATQSLQAVAAHRFAYRLALITQR